VTDTLHQGLTVHLPFATVEEFLQRYGEHLTRGGIYLRARSLKAPGTSVVLELRLEQGERVLYASAVVSWVTGARGSGVPGMGFKFISLDAPSRRLLEAAAASMPHARSSEPPVPRDVGPVDSSPEALYPTTSPSQSQPRLPSEDSGQLSVHGDVTDVRAPPFEAAPEPPHHGPIIGIELGTSNARAALVLESGEPAILRREAQGEIPAVVALSARGRFLVGTAARGQLVTNPRWAVTGFKRLLGRAPTAVELQETLRRLPYEVLASEAGTCAVRLADRAYPIEELCALVLREVKALAEERLKVPVHRAVISVPSWYGEPQQAAMQRAGLLAGLHVEHLVSDATAAAMAWARPVKPPPRVLVYDLGGGTFDASVLELRDGAYDLVCSGGDTFLGGVDFDAAVATWALAEFTSQTGVALSDRVAVQRVYEAAERAKIALSERPEARLTVALVTVANQRALDLDLTLTRPVLDRLTRPLVDRTMEICQELMRSRGLRADEIDAVVLAGGQSRALMVQERLTLMFGKKPVTAGNPEDAVALGAALIAASIAQRDGQPAIERLPTSIGVGLPGGRFQSVIPNGTPLPTRRTFVLSTTKDNQPAFQLLVFQGESTRASENAYLGTFRVDKLPPAPRGGVTIELTFELDRDCLLTVAARDAASQRDVSAHYATRDTPSVIKDRLKDLETQTPVPMVPPHPAGGVFGWVRKLLGNP
jgi:molecular chaperone DnaK